MKSSHIIFNFGTWNITVREIIAAPIIIGVMVVLGFVIAGKIDDQVQASNLVYNSAPHIETVEDFKDRLATDKRNIFSSGHHKTVNPIGFNAIYKSMFLSPNESDLPDGRYLFIEIEREHYTRHTRTTTDSKGHTHTRVYYSWDSKETVKNWASNVIFNGVEFSSSKFEYKISSGYLGCIRHGNDRWKFRAIKPDFDCIIFTMVSDGDISDNTPVYTQFENIDSLVEYLTDSHAVLIFWIIWIVMIVAAVIGFFYLDNSFLEE